MRFTIFILFCVFLFSAAALNAQLPCSQTLSGRVLSETGAPLANAEVILQTPNRGQATDVDGNFSLKSWLPEYRLSAMIFL